MRPGSVMALVALALVCASCGSDVDTQDAIERAAANTSDSSTARIERVSRTTVEGHTYEVRTTGVFDYSRGRGEYTTRIESFAGRS